MQTVDLAMVDWSRAQFALTAIYHFLFVPLTLGLSFIVAIMESIYVKTGDARWKTLTLFWMKLFGINFAIGLATGIIMEFEFGTNWSNYSWMVGDIFGAPLAVEGIMAFFMESTFFAVMFFGWKKVSKRMHLLSTWLVALGSNLSALWILVANGWMQHPAGMVFNPDTARNEMADFWAVLFNPHAVSKFIHTVSAGYVTGGIFVVGISAWFLLKNKSVWMAKKSILVGATFGLVSSIYLIIVGDTSAYVVAHTQPAKLAAMEGIYDGKSKEGIVVAGVLNPKKQIGDDREEYLFKVEVPYALSLLGFHRTDAFVAGANDLVAGSVAMNIMSAADKIARGRRALEALKRYKEAKSAGDVPAAQTALQTFREHERYMGYGYLNDPKSIIPNIPLTFYSFHIMVGLGGWFLALFIAVLFYTMTHSIHERRLWLRLALFSLPLPYIASEAGWIVAEVGRQPWAIQDILPTIVASSNLDATTVMTTFWMFAVIFTALLIAEVGIMVKQIRLKAEEHHV